MKTQMAVNRFGFFVLGMLAMVLLCGHAHGQSLAGVGGGQQAPTSNTYQMYSHPAHADQHAMGTEESLLGSNAVTEAHGERPLWEFGSDKVEEPLGDVARRFRDMPRTKATLIYEQQGK